MCKHCVERSGSRGGAGTRQRHPVDVRGRSTKKKNPGADLAVSFQDEGLNGERRPWPRILQFTYTHIRRRILSLNSQCVLEEKATATGKVHEVQLVDEMFQLDSLVCWTEN